MKSIQDQIQGTSAEGTAGSRRVTQHRSSDRVQSRIVDISTGIRGGVAVTSSWLEIRMLYNADKWKVRIGDVMPIGFRKASIQLEDKAYSNSSSVSRGRPHARIDLLTKYFLQGKSAGG